MTTTPQPSPAPPGVVPVSEWRPGHVPVQGVSADMYAGLATVTGRPR
jgi:hypothetical protein